MVGSLLGAGPGYVIKSSVLYLPAILVGLFGERGSSALWAACLFGKSPVEILTLHVLPIMGGGPEPGGAHGSGVLPWMSGQDSSGYLSLRSGDSRLVEISVSVVFAVILLNTSGQSSFRPSPAKGRAGAQRKNISIEKKVSVKSTMWTMWRRGIFLRPQAFSSLAQLVLPRRSFPPSAALRFSQLCLSDHLRGSANVLEPDSGQFRRALQRCLVFCGNKMIWIQIVDCGSR